MVIVSLSQSTVLCQLEAPFFTSNWKTLTLRSLGEIMARVMKAWDIPSAKIPYQSFRHPSTQLQRVIRSDTIYAIFSYIFILHPTPNLQNLV